MNEKNELKKTPFYAFFKRNSKIIFLGLIILINYLVFINNYSDASNDSQQLLLLSYQDIGFSSRVFAGTLLRLLGFSVEHTESINVFLNILYLAVSGLFFFIVVKVFSGNKADRKQIEKSNDIEPWFIYICACPLFLYGFSFNLYGSANVFLIFLMLICFLLLQNQKSAFLIPVICVSAILTDHVFSLIYLPVICLLLWNKFKINGEKIYGSVFKITLISGILTTVLMLCFSFKSEFPTYYYGSNARIFSVNNFSLLQDFCQNCGNNNLGLDDEILWLFITLPSIVFLVYLWQNCFKLSKGISKKIFKLCLIHMLLCLPSLIYFKGFRSWLVSLLISQSVLVLGMLYQKDKTVGIVFEKINLILKKNSAVFIGIVFVFYFLISVLLPMLNVK